MAIHVALLRAVNVGGTGKLAMRDLIAVCETIGFDQVRTYIQSGNVVFKSRLGEAKVKARLEKALAAAGTPTRVLVRDRAEIEAVLRRNPYRDAAPNRVLVFFLDRSPGQAAVGDIVVPGNEELTLEGRDLYIHYPDGMGRSKLKLPLANEGTGRNLNTVRKLVAMAQDL